MSHKTKALILCCLDPLARPKVAAYYDKEMGETDYDLLSVAGAAMHL